MQAEEQETWGTFVIGRDSIASSGLELFVEFCSPFDRALAQSGPPAVFLLDPEGAWRFDASWTRDAWGRAPGPHEHGLRWLLLRDRGNGFVVIALVSSPTLIVEHPRLDVRSFDTPDAAFQERARFGEPPLASSPW